jgi:hypothetical protein
MNEPINQSTQIDNMLLSCLKASLLGAGHRERGNTIIGAFFTSVK